MIQGEGDDVGVVQVGFLVVELQFFEYGSLQLLRKGFKLYFFGWLNVRLVLVLVGVVGQIVKVVMFVIVNCLVVCKCIVLYVVYDGVQFV